MQAYYQQNEKNIKNMEFENQDKFNESEGEQEKTLIKKRKDFLKEFFKRMNEQIERGVEPGIFGPMSEGQIKEIIENIKEESSILEIGSYDGLLLEQLRNNKKDYKLTGSDIRKDSLEAIKKRVPEAEIMPFDVIEDKFEDKFKNKFDVIFMKFVLGCLPLKEAELALEKEDRLLSLQEQEEIWDKALEKVKNNCKQFILITPVLKEGIAAKDVEIRPIFVPDDILQKLLNKHFGSKELLGVQKDESDKDFNAEVYLLSEPKID